MLTIIELIYTRAKQSKLVRRTTTSIQKHTFCADIANSFSLLRVSIKTSRDSMRGHTAVEVTYGRSSEVLMRSTRAHQRRNHDKSNQRFSQL